MYRSALDNRDKGGAILGVTAVHVALGLAFLHLSGTVNLADPQEALQVFDIVDAPPPPPKPPPPPPIKTEAKAQPKAKEGAASPKNIKSEATPIVAPKPQIEIPRPPPVAASETPREGTAPTQGASNVRGPGTGAGGIGNGTGSGGAGNGSGGGGGGGMATVRTRLATRPLRGRDFPPSLLDAWPPGAWAYMRIRVSAEGAVLQCIMDRGTGAPNIDAQICDIVRQKLRYRPALDRYGRRVADWAGYGQEPPR
ncbi:MAG: energy transducer TonB [Sphingomicrobium sp.]